MMAVLVITVARLFGPVPTASSASLSARLSARRLAAISRGRAAAVDQRREAVAVARAVPEEAFTAGEELGGETAQALLGAELEERVGLDPRLLGDVVLAGLDGLLHAVERAGDEVEVGARVVRQPGLGEDRVGGRDDRLGVIGQHRRVGHVLAARGRLEIVPELLQRARDAARRRRRRA